MCGVCALVDKKEPAIFPRWVGWVAVIVAASWVPFTFLPYFDMDPFAIDGIFSIYIVSGTLVAWFCFYSHSMFRSQADNDVAQPGDRAGDQPRLVKLAEAGLARQAAKEVGSGEQRS